MVDLDSDGRADILSGSYAPGNLILFAGREGGRFAPPQVLQDSQKTELRVGRASVPFACDWDRDGDLDLVIGNMLGRVFLARNTSGGRGLSFAAAVPLVVGGEELKLTETNASPCVVDWDRDGNADLLLGVGDGSVLFYRNTSATGEPVLAAPTEIVAKNEGLQGAQRLARSGLRARVAVCDWNADGRLDLVLGEYAPEDGADVVLDDAGRRALQATIQEGVSLGEKRGALEHQALEAWLQRQKIPPQQASEHYEEFLKEWSESAEAREITARQAELAELMKKLSPELIEHGRVWVLLRRPSDH